MGNLFFYNSEIGVFFQKLTDTCTGINYPSQK